MPDPKHLPHSRIQARSLRPPLSLSTGRSGRWRRCGHKHRREEAHRRRALVGNRKARADGEFQGGARFMPQHLVGHPSGLYALQHIID